MDRLYCAFLSWIGERREFPEPAGVLDTCCASSSNVQYSDLNCITFTERLHREKMVTSTRLSIPRPFGAPCATV